MISVGEAVTRYTSELIRLIAQMSLGTGALVMICGTTAIHFIPTASPIRAGIACSTAPECGETPTLGGASTRHCKP